MYKRFIILVLVFVFTFNTVCVSVYALDNGSGGHFSEGYTDEEIRAAIDAHINFSISKNGYTDQFKHNGEHWQINGIFHLSDDDLYNYLIRTYKGNDIFSIASRVYDAVVSVIASKIGYIDKTYYEDIDNILNDLGIDYINAHVTSDVTGALNFDSDIINEIKKHIQQRYIYDNGLIKIPSKGNVMQAITQFEGKFEYVEDYTDFFARNKDYDYAIVINNLWFNGLITFDKEDFLNLYFNSNVLDVDYGRVIYTADSDLKGSAIDTDTLFNNMYFANADLSDAYTLGYYNNKAESIFNNLDGTDRTFDLLYPVYKLNEGCSNNGYSYTWNRCNGPMGGYLYSNDGAPLYIYESYEKLYNFVHGEGTYIASKFYEDLINVQITQTDLTANIEQKLIDIYDVIANGSGSIANSEKMQKLIDDSLETFDKIQEGVEDTNDNLKSIMDILREQNDILLELLDVTYSIDRSVNNIEAMTAVETILMLFNQFNSCVEKMKTSFPFSVPFDIYLMFGLLSAEPEAPRFEVDFNPMLSSHNVEYQDNLVVVVDFANFEQVSFVSRGFLSLLFLLYITILTRNLFFNGGKVK